MKPRASTAATCGSPASATTSTSPARRRRAFGAGASRSSAYCAGASGNGARLRTEPAGRPRRRQRGSGRSGAVSRRCGRVGDDDAERPDVASVSAARRDDCSRSATGSWPASVAPDWPRERGRARPGRGTRTGGARVRTCPGHAHSAQEHVAGHHEATSDFTCCCGRGRETLAATLSARVEDIASLSVYIRRHLNVQGRHSFQRRELAGARRPLRARPRHCRRGTGLITRTRRAAVVVRQGIVSRDARRRS